LSGYRKLRDAGKEAALREALRAVVTAHGVEAQVKVTAGGQPVGACEVVRFRHGEVEYVGIVVDDNVEGVETVQATIAFPRVSQFYDVRGKRHLGRVSSVQAEITPGVPLLYAMLPYTVDGLGLRAGRASYAPGDAAKLGLSLRTSAGALAGAHVIRVEVAGPDGQVRRHYAQNVLTRSPEATAVVPFAYNDPAGQWSVTARDVVSGRAAKLSLRLVR